MKPRLPQNHLRRLRLRHEFTQHELGVLLGVSGATVSKYERRVVQPSLAVLVAAEVVFGGAAREAFSSLRNEIEDKTIAQASQLYDRLETKGGDQARRKMQRLLAMIDRTVPRPTQV